MHTCRACGSVVEDSRATVYTAAGDLVCLDCGARADEVAAVERRVGSRRSRIVTSVAVASALVAFALFALVYHDRRFAYVENGHVLETSDASWSVLQAGIGVALFAAFLGGILTHLVMARRAAGRR
jgi:hypothetical protein